MALVPVTVPSTKAATCTHTGYMTNPLTVQNPGKVLISVIDDGDMQNPPDFELKLNIGGDDVYLSCTGGKAPDLYIGTGAKITINAKLYAAASGTGKLQLIVGAPLL